MMTGTDLLAIIVVLSLPFLLLWERLDFYDHAKICPRCQKMDRPGNGKKMGAYNEWFCNECLRTGKTGWTVK